MKLMYPKEHASCLSRDEEGNSRVEYLVRTKGSQDILVLPENEIVLILKGTLLISYDKFEPRRVPAQHMLVLPSSHQLTVEADEDLSMIVCRLRTELQLCDHLSFEQLSVSSIGIHAGINFLKMDERLSDYVSGLYKYIQSGLLCSSFYDLKMKELFFLLRVYYPKEELAGFLFPLFKSNVGFSNFVYKNYHRVKSVKDLAAISTYSLSGFEKRFKRVFGLSAHEWMKKQKAKAVFQDICSTSELFKELSLKHGFSSPSHFNDFCKAHFGKTPGDIRSDCMKNKHGV